MKHIKHIIVSFSLVLLTLASRADTLTVMHYNLLYYNAKYSDCDATTNSTDVKDRCLATIVAHVKPDIISVNEMGASTESANRLLAAINAAGVGTFDRAERDANDDLITNLILFNTQRVRLGQQQAVATTPRHTQFYTLQIVAANISLTYAVTHLKAGQTESDTATRATAARAIMSHIAAKNLNGNLILAGDMNIYDGSEPAMTTFCSPSAPIRLYDPIDRIGPWHENSNYADLHTQSTRTTETSCFVHGGLDDRFDLILTSAPLLSSSNSLQFVSLKALGNDGNRFNKSIISPANTSVPDDVAQALYDMSDHLPVVAKFIYNPTATYLEQQQYTKFHLKVLNPIKEQAFIELFDSNASIKQIDIYDIMGYRHVSQRYTPNTSQATLPTQNLHSGLYLLRISLHDGRSTTVKVIKQ